MWVNVQAYRHCNEVVLVSVTVQLACCKCIYPVLWRLCIVIYTLKSCVCVWGGHHCVSCCCCCRTLQRWPSSSVRSTTSHRTAEHSSLYVSTVCVCVDGLLLGSCYNNTSCVLVYTLCVCFSDCSIDITHMPPPFTLTSSHPHLLTDRLAPRQHQVWPSVPSCAGCVLDRGHPNLFHSPDPFLLPTRCGKGRGQTWDIILET